MSTIGIRPVSEIYKVSQAFGTNPGGHNPAGGHTGTDYAAPEGTPIVAIADGVVTHANWGTALPGDNSHAGYASRLYLEKASVGIGVVLMHDDVYSTYSHLSRTDLNIGDKVKQGDLLGYVGQTGLAYGSHLHFEILPRNPNYSNGLYGRINTAPYTTGKYFRNSTVANKPVVKTQSTTNGSGYPYTLITSLTSPNQSTRAYFGHTGRPTGIVWHWWNTPDKAGSAESTARWLSNSTSQVSAHYVVSGTTIYCLVSPEKAAWHSGTAKFNGSTIGIEVDPRLPKGTLETCAQLAYELETNYGSQLFYGHRDVNPGTQCPGVVYSKIPELIKMTNELVKNKGKAPIKVIPTTTKPVEVKPVAKTKSTRETNPTGWAVWSYKNPKVTNKDAYATLNENNKLLKEVNSKLDELLKDKDVA